MSLLDDFERQRANRLIRPADRRAFIAAHTLKRLILANVIRHPPQQLDFYYDLHGKPRLTGHSRVHFSLSHTHGMVAFAYDSHEAAGVDVEHSDASVYDRSVAALCLTPEETSLVEESADPNRAFMYFWTAKEAAMKAEGLAISLRDIHIADGAAATQHNHWLVRHYQPSERHILALANRELLGGGLVSSATVCLAMKDDVLWQWALHGDVPPQEKFTSFEAIEPEKFF